MMRDRTITFDYRNFGKYPSMVFYVCNGNDTQDVIYEDFLETDTAEEAMGCLRQFYETEEGMVDFSESVFAIKYREDNYFSPDMTTEIDWAELSLLADISDKSERDERIMLTFPGNSAVLEIVRKTISLLAVLYKEGYR